MFEFKFAFRPPPLPDELLSSWMHRTGSGMFFRPYAFVHTYWQSVPPVLSRDIDLMADPRVVRGMAFGTSTEAYDAFRTTIPSFAGWLYDGRTTRGLVPWVLPVGVRNRERKLPGQQFCPLCLAADAQPYLRRKWRLALASVCTQHRVQLLDRCQNCYCALAIFRSPEIYACWNCHSDLREAVTVTAGQPALDFDKIATKALTLGWAQLGSSVFHYSPAYFVVLRQLGRTIISGPRSQALRSVLASPAAVSDEPFAFEGGRSEVEFLCSSERHRMHAMILELLSDWPHAYVAAMSKARMWHSWALRDLDAVPFALVQVVDQNLRLGSYTPPLAEVKAAAAYLAARGATVGYRGMRRLLGESIHTAEAVASIASPPVSPDSLVSAQPLPQPQNGFRDCLNRGALRPVAKRTRRQKVPVDQ